MKYISHIIETKGVVHSVERMLQILRRYSFGKKRFFEMMSYLENELKRDNMKVTFCIPAALLDSHKEFLKDFQTLGHEFAAHGYFHTNIRKKKPEEQAEILKMCYQTFKTSGIPVYGFRCPYLSYDRNTVDALMKSQFIWMSNDVIIWGDIAEENNGHGHLKKLTRLYRTLDANSTLSLPRTYGKVVDIPITAPDDEMVFDRFRVKDSREIGRIWTRIFRKVYGRGELFHLLFHPERFLYIKDSLRSVIRESNGCSPGVWCATLHDITRWWVRRKHSVWSCERMNGGYSVAVDAPPEATLLIKSGRPGNFYKNYSIASAPSSKPFSIYAKDQNVHTIGIPEGAPAALEEFLKDEGFFAVRRRAPAEGSLFIDGFDSFTEYDRLKLLEKIDSSPYPLLRLWRWPYGNRSALAVSSDIDSINISDFFKRMINF